MSERYRTARLVQRRIESISKDSLQLVGELETRTFPNDYLGRWLTHDLRSARGSIRDILEALEQLGEGESGY